MKDRYDARLERELIHCDTEKELYELYSPNANSLRPKLMNSEDYGKEISEPSKNKSKN